jgi:hypothetical protein
MLLIAESMFIGFFVNATEHTNSEYRQRKNYGAWNITFKVKKVNLSPIIGSGGL